MKPALLALGLVACVSLVSIAALPVAGATATWSAPQRVASEGEAISLALGQGGRATLFFHRMSGYPQVFASVRAAGESFGPPQAISPPDQTTHLLDAVVDRDGLLTALMVSGSVLEVRSGPVGGPLASRDEAGEDHTVPVKPA